MLRWAERLLWVSGVALLAGWALVIADARISQHAALRALEHSTSRAAPIASAASIPAGTPLALLNIPRVHLTAVVLHGSDARTLRRGPGHLENSAVPGAGGNVVIAGHRDSFFRPLKDVAIGDDVFLQTPTGSVRYRVTALGVVTPSDLTPLQPTGDAVLTLITCYPFWLLGDAPDRFIVRAERVSSASSMTTTAHLDRIVPPPAARPRDDETRIREMIESYRSTYNGLAASRHSEPGVAPLRFAQCDIRIDNDGARASCGPPARTFVLARVDGRWTMTSIRVE